MEIKDRIKKDLESSDESSIIYYFDAGREEQAWRDCIFLATGSKYGYLDIPIFDYRFLIPAFEENAEKYNSHLMRKFLYDRIIMLSKTGSWDQSTFDKKNIDRIKSRTLQSLIEELNERAKNFPKGKVRLHIFLNGKMKNELLQIAINDLIASKSIITRVYETDTLVTKKTSSNQELLAPFDYKYVESYERVISNREYQRSRR